MTNRENNLFIVLSYTSTKPSSSRSCHQERGSLPECRLSSAPLPRTSGPRNPRRPGLPGEPRSFPPTEIPSAPGRRRAGLPGSHPSMRLEAAVRPFSNLFLPSSAAQNARGYHHDPFFKPAIQASTARSEFNFQSAVPTTIDRGNSASPQNIESEVRSLPRRQARPRAWAAAPTVFDTGFCSASMRGGMTSGCLICPSARAAALARSLV